VADLPAPWGTRMATLDEIGDYLEDYGAGVQGVDLFLGSRPEGPDNCLTVYEYPGGPPEYIQDSFAPVAERVQIQVVARSGGYEEAHRRASVAWAALAVVTNATLGSTKYRSIRPNSSPALMGRDPNDRILVFFNATVEKEVSLAESS